MFYNIILMGLFDKLKEKYKEADEKLGGYLPGGKTPKEVKQEKEIKQEKLKKEVKEITGKKEFKGGMSVEDPKTGKGYYVEEGGKVEEATPEARKRVQRRTRRKRLTELTPTEKEQIEQVKKESGKVAGGIETGIIYSKKISRHLDTSPEPRTDEEKKRAERGEIGREITSRVISAPFHLLSAPERVWVGSKQGDYLKAGGGVFDIATLGLFGRARQLSKITPAIRSQTVVQSTGTKTAQAETYFKTEFPKILGGKRDISGRAESISVKANDKLSVVGTRGEMTEAQKNIFNKNINIKDRGEIEGISMSQQEKASITKDLPLTDTLKAEIPYKDATKYEGISISREVGKKDKFDISKYTGVRLKGKGKDYSIAQLFKSDRSLKTGGKSADVFGEIFIDKSISRVGGGGGGKPPKKIDLTDDKKTLQQITDKQMSQQIEANIGQGVSQKFQSEMKDISTGARIGFSTPKSINEQSQFKSTLTPPHLQDKNIQKISGDTQIIFRERAVEQKPNKPFKPTQRPINKHEPTQKPNKGKRRSQRGGEDVIILPDSRGKQDLIFKSDIVSKVDETKSYIPPPPPFIPNPIDDDGYLPPPPPPPFIPKPIDDGITPPPFMFKLPSFNAEFGKIGTLRARRGYAYTPSFGAIVGKVKGKAPTKTRFTGLEVRPITKGFDWGKAFKQITPQKNKKRRKNKRRKKK